MTLAKGCVIETHTTVLTTILDGGELVTSFLWSDQTDPSSNLNSLFRTACRITIWQGRASLPLLPLLLPLLLPSTLLFLGEVSAPGQSRATPPSRSRHWRVWLFSWSGVWWGGLVGWPSPSAAERAWATVSSAPPSPGGWVSNQTF